MCRKEEDEENDADMRESSQEKDINYAKSLANAWSSSVTYADILAGKCDQKRKLSENVFTSDGEDSEFEYEN